MNSKLALYAHLLRGLAHGTHPLLYVVRRVSGSLNHGYHAIQARPAVQADVPDAR
jgi:hypothetical protein